MKRYLLTISFLLFFIVLANAQNDDQLTDSFWQDRQRMLDEFQDFRKEMNEEYVLFLKGEWIDYNLERGIESELGPKPLSVPMAPTQTSPELTEILVVEKDEPVIPIEQLDINKPKRQTNNNKKIAILFYGSRINTEHNLSSLQMTRVRDRDIANVWESFSKSSFQNMVLDLLQYKEKNKLNDWAMYKLINIVAKQIPELADNNSRVVFSHFLLTQCGYNLRICIVDGSLALLVPIHETIYRWNFYSADGLKHYILSDYEEKDVKSVKTCDFKKKTNGSSLSVKVKGQMKFSELPRHKKLIYNDFSTSVSVNQNLIDFYFDYPQCDLSLYSGATVSQGLGKLLLKDIDKYLKGKDAESTLQWLLHFVHYAFAYETDAKQFGYEKPFFLEEVFYYPYSDCEDRAFLLRWLVQNILHTETILLSYPGHLSTAVHIEPLPKGNIISYKNKKYIAADPTYINSNIGETMPAYKGVTPKIISVK